MIKRLLMTTTMLILTLWLVSQPTTVAACTMLAPDPSIPTTTPEQFDAYINRIPVIVEAEVIKSIEKDGYTEVKVKWYLKGSGAGEIEIVGFGYGADCLPVAGVGGSGLLYLKPDGVKYALVLGGLLPNDSDLIARITSVVGTPQPVNASANPAQSDSNATNSGSRTLTRIVVGVSIIGVLLVVGGIAMQRRKTPRS